MPRVHGTQLFSADFPELLQTKLSPLAWEGGISSLLYATPPPPSRFGPKAPMGGVWEGRWGERGGGRAGSLYATPPSPPPPPRVLKDSGAGSATNKCL